MNNKSTSNISFIGGFYIFSSVVLLVTIITGSYKTDIMNIALRHGLVHFHELPIRAILIIAYFIIGLGLLKLKKWAWVLISIYCLYFIIANIVINLDTGNKDFYGNIIFSVWVLITLPRDRKAFK